MANGNGSNGGNGKLRSADAILASAILDLCDGIKVEVIKMEGMAHVIVHRRLVTTRPFRAEFLASVRRVGQRHIDMAERVQKALVEET